MNLKKIIIAFYKISIKIFLSKKGKKINILKRLCITTLVSLVIKSIWVIVVRREIKRVIIIIR